MDYWSPLKPPARLKHTLVLVVNGKCGTGQFGPTISVVRGLHTP